jgi:uncharacterized protein (DUF433 family)
MPHPRIVINPKIMIGKPVIKGTRVPVVLILHKLLAGLSVQEIIRQHPQLVREDIQAAVDYAAAREADEEIETG